MQNSPHYILYRARRPLKREASTSGNKNKIIIILLGAIILFAALVIYLTSSSFSYLFYNHEKSIADNQTLNWMRAKNIYNFKIKRLDGSYFYLSELKNRVLLILK